MVKIRVLDLRNCYSTVTQVLLMISSTIYVCSRRRIDNFTGQVIAFRLKKVLVHTTDPRQPWHKCGKRCTVCDA